MLHQILCSLQGKTGSIIKRYRTQISVDPSITYLNQPQIDLINQICKCGYYYHKITDLIQLEFSQNQLQFNVVNVQMIKSKSVYRKAMYEGLKYALRQYNELILGIQQEFLKNKHFTLANLKAELQPFQLIMKQITDIVYQIYDNDLKGGLVINFLYLKYQNSNVLLQKWLKQMLTKTIKVFLNQVNMWILYGQIQDIYSEFFVHKVLTQSSQKYRFKPKTGKDIEITDWDMFTLEQCMIPGCLIQTQTAGKILLIGKIIKILRSANKISSIPDVVILGKISKISQIEYDQVAYEGMIQQIRQIVARKIIEFIMKEENLVKQLEKLNDYYLMFKGDFYHHFFEEAKKIESIAQREKAQKKINQVYLHNTFIRLGEDQDIKRLSFELKTLGFSYNSFKNFLNFCPVGNIDLLQGKAIRFNSTGSALWNRSKQIVDNNFTMVYSFSFRKIKNMSMLKNKVNQAKQYVEFSMILQNCKEISGSTHQNPAYLSRLGQYLAVKVDVRFSEEEKNYVSSIVVVYKDAKRNQKQIEVGRCTPKGLNFMNEKSYSIKVHYSNQTLKVELTGENGQKSQIKQSIKMNNYLDFQMGRAYLGFVSGISQMDSSIDLEQWQMISKSSAFYNNHWNDLYLNFKVQWPINLIITPDLIEAYNRIHKFLFPIRQIQIQLESIWFAIPKLIKTGMRSTREEMKELKIFERQLAALRSEISLVVNNFWAYFLSDIAQVLWGNLVKTLQVEKDFEDVIRSVKKYTQSLQIMYFFNASKIQKKITQIIQKARQFIIFFKNLESESYIDQSEYQNLAQIDDGFNKQVSEFYRLLKDLSKTNTSQYLYHMAKRIEGCVNQHKIERNI